MTTSTSQGRSVPLVLSFLPFFITSSNFWVWRPMWTAQDCGPAPQNVQPANAGSAAAAACLASETSPASKLRL